MGNESVQPGDLRLNLRDLFLERAQAPEWAVLTFMVDHGASPSLTFQPAV
jgi:hypothetical protein